MATNIDNFTVSMRTEFLNTYYLDEPDPIAQIYQVLPSNTKIENYSWMSAAPGFREFTGARLFAKIDHSKYTVINQKFTGEFMVLLEDLEDDQVGGYPAKSKELAENARAFPSEEVLRGLATAKTAIGFDGTAIAADTHSFGSGDNLMAFTAASGDAVNHVLVFLVKKRAIKPIFWQNRSMKGLMTNAGESRSEEEGFVKYWADLRGAVGFGYWYDLIWTDVTNTPSLTELQTIFGNAEARFREFQRPKGQEGEDIRYMHQNIDFTSDSLAIVNSTKISHLVRTVLNESMISNSTNAYKGWAQHINSAYLNP